MNQIAAAGGTGQAIFINNGHVTTELLAALQQIQTEATLPCQFSMPQGDNVDPTKVNVEQTSGGGSSQQIGQVAGPQDCANVNAGWYYDDPADPSTIILCPDTCDNAQGDPNGRIDIVVGCDTVAAEPR